MQSIILPPTTRRNRRRHSRARRLAASILRLVGLALVAIAAVRCTRP